MANLSHLIPLAFHDQIELLKSRGMLFDDEERAEKYFAYIGYHRLSTYWNAFYQNIKERDNFIKGVKFEDILNLYIFDRKLRVLFFEASERIEICMKVLLSDALSVASNNPFWYKDANFFNTRIDTYYTNEIAQKEICDHEWIIKKLDEYLQKSKKSDLFLKGFKNINNTPIPSWELVNLLTFGTFSNIMSLIKGDKSASVYERFGLPKRILDNWLECVVGVRNICAHYSLLYRRSFSTTPMSLSKSKKRSVNIDLEYCKTTFYAQFFIFNYLIKKISPTSTWGNRVIALIKEYLGNPLLSQEKMGLSDDWESKILSL